MRLSSLVTVESTKGCASSEEVLRSISEGKERIKTKKKEE